MQEGALHARNTIAVPDYIDMDEEELALQQVSELVLSSLSLVYLPLEGSRIIFKVIQYQDLNPKNHS